MNPHPCAEPIGGFSWTDGDSPAQATPYYTIPMLYNTLVILYQTKYTITILYYDMRDYTNTVLY